MRLRERGPPCFQILDYSLLFSLLPLHVLSKTALLSAPKAAHSELCVCINEKGSMCEKRESTKEEEERERRMMGQVWNLHTLLVACTIGIYASV